MKILEVDRGGSLAVAPIAVNVDLGVAEALRLVDEILARRGQRRRQVVQDVLDDVEAAEIIVRRLDKLYTDILNEFASRRVSETTPFSLISSMKLVSTCPDENCCRSSTAAVKRSGKPRALQAKRRKSSAAFSTWAIDAHTHEVLGAAASKPWQEQVITDRYHFLCSREDASLRSSPFSSQAAMCNECSSS